MSSERVPLGRLLAYFLKLGTFGFGGPIALAEAMERDLVEERGWVSADDYREGLALSQLAPGPLAAQLAMYLGHVHSGAVGATAVAFAFIGPSFLMVLALSAAYARFGGLEWMQSAFYGVGAAVIGLIAKSAWGLARRTVGKDPLRWALFALSAAATAATGREIAWLFAASGLVAAAAERARRPPALAADGLGAVFLYFAKSSLFVFGSGLAIVPFLHGGVVLEHRWLTERQFLDAIAVAMITPGPVVITVAFIGYLAAGPLGACAAAAGVFLPVYLVVVGLADRFRRHAASPGLKAFVGGVTASAVGALAGAVAVLARGSVRDGPTALIAAGTLLAVSRRKVPEPLVVAAAAALGLLLRGG